MSNKTQEFISKAVSKHGDKYDYSKVNYTHSKIKITIICKEHGEFEQKPNLHLNGSGCPSCSGNVRLSLDSFKQKAVTIHGIKYDYSKVNYVNARSKVQIICDKHGIFDQTPHDHLKGSGCPSCAGVSFVSFDDFKERAFNIHGIKYEYIEVSDGKTKSDVLVVCPKHGSFKQRINSHLNGKGCVKCGYDDLSLLNRSDLQTFLDKCYEVHGDKYDYSAVDYVNSRTNIKILCPKHGAFDQSPSNHLQGHGCPKCTNSVSDEHSKILSILDEFNVSYVVNDRSIFKGLEIDVWVPDYKLGVEINGCYWHGLRIDNVENHSRLSSIHSLKADLARDNGIVLYQLWDFEINNNLDIIRSMVSHKLNKSRKIYARNCEVKRIENGDVVDFFNKSHLQGYRSAKVNYGLYYDDLLISAVSFSANNNYQWEVMRYATLGGHVVVGGFSRLFKRFLSDFNPNSVMTFADRRISFGNVYRSNGFVDLKITKPNYFYQRGRTRLSRQRCQKHKLSKLLPNYVDSLSEKDNMLLNGFNKIHDAGNYQLLWSK